MKFKSLFVLLVFSGFYFSQQDKKTAQLDQKMEALLDLTKASGFAVSVVKNNQVIYSKGFGYRDYENKIKVDDQTLFAIGSTSKAFTTALLGIMREEKQLSFSDSPRKYLPELNFFNDELNTKLTITDLICHRTGLPRHDFSWYLFPTESKDSLLKRIAYQEPFTGLREQWYYNNFMYLTQGLITEKLTGRSWEENIKEHFFTPLLMTNSNLSIKELQQHKNSSKGYKLVDNKKIVQTEYYNIAAMGPAGSINSNVSEMSNWLKVWINGGKFNGKQIIPAKYIQEAISPRMLVGNSIPTKEFPDQHLNSYGYAWFISSYKGHYRVEHGGNIDGFSANVCFFPTDSIGIVVLCNQDGSALPNLVRNTIADFMLNLNKTDWEEYYRKKLTEIQEAESSEKKKAEEEKSQISIPSHNLTEYTGAYKHSGYGNFTIDLINDSLFAQFPVLRMYLKPDNHDVFQPILVENGKIDSNSGLGFKFNFKSNDLGDISFVDLKLEPTLDPLAFQRTPKIVKIESDALEKLTGNYLLSGVALKVYLNKQNELILSVPQQPEYTLQAINDSEFTIKGLNGYKVAFVKNETEQLEMKLIQPNGTFKATKK